MKNLFYACVCCVAALVTGACSDDGKDDVLPVTQNNLVGKWELVKEYDAEEDLWDEEWGDAYGFYSRIEFRADGKVIQRDKFPEDPDWKTTEGSYSLEGDKLSVHDPEEGVLTVRIERLTPAELILADDYIGEDGKSYTDKQVYRRIG